MTDFSGQTIGQYQIIDLIGRGGMANVYRAVQPSIGREVAIKILPAHFMQDETFLSRFNLEVKMVARLQHPHILQVYDFGEEAGQPYIVMTLLTGGSLSDRILEFPGGMPLDEVSEIVAQIARGLDFAHEKGIIHRDFKPSNVLLDEQRNAYLADFGIAKASESTAQLTGSGIVGTPSYMAPEMSTPDGLSKLVDVYALGVTLYQMLTGRAPYEAPTPMGVLMAHMGQPIPDAREIRPDLPDDIQRVIVKGMAKNPAQRYQSARELSIALNAALGITVPSRPTQARILDDDDDGETMIAPPLPRSHPATAPQDEDLTPTELVPRHQQEDSSLPVTQLGPPPSRSADPTILERDSGRQGGLPGWIWAGVGGGVVALILGVTLIVTLIGNGGESDQATDDQPEEPPVTEEVAEEQDAPQSTDAPPPTDAPDPTDVPTEVPTEEPTDAPTDPVSLAEAGVTGNGQWEPYYQDFGGFRMALVPAGCFQMGSRNGDPDELPVHEQCFDRPFWIDVYEVTNSAYGSTGWFYGDSLPREKVSWNQAQAFCERRGGRLPTEVEWEYAGRGPDNLVYPWGDRFISSKVIWLETSGEVTHAVGSSGDIAWVGAYEMAGNVGEWTSSLLWDYPYDPGDGRESLTASGERVIRGASFLAELEIYFRSADRYSLPPSTQDYNFGFRCVRDY